MAFLKRQYTTVAIVAVVLAILIACAAAARLGSRGRLPDRRDPLGRGRLHRHDRLGPRQRAHRRSGARRPRPGAQRRVPRRHRHRACSSSASASSRSAATTRSCCKSTPATPPSSLGAMVGLAFGCSLISVFARLGGGIYTKAADVGADLVGKVEAGIPEDDPRNPAVIADNVGDNVGDCAGMAADLFETYCRHDGRRDAARPPRLRRHVCPARRRSRSCSARSRSSPRSSARSSSACGKVEQERDHGRALPRHDRRRRALARSASSSSRSKSSRRRHGRSARHARSASSSARSSAWSITGLITFITEYYTGTQFPPVQEHRESLGHRTRDQHHRGPGGLDAGARRCRRIVIVLGILVSYGFAGMYGVGIAVMSMLSMAGIVVAIDSFGPITDNAGGIAEMAEMPEDVRNVTDPLDAVGNTTKAVTKGYAIGSAGARGGRALRVVLARADQTKCKAAGGRGMRRRRRRSLRDRQSVRARAASSSAACCRISSPRFRWKSVGRAAGAVVEEVRRQFREIPGIMDGTPKPELRHDGRHRDARGAQRDDRPGAHSGRRADHRRAALGLRRPAGRHRRADDGRHPGRLDRHRPLPRDLDDDAAAARGTTPRSTSKTATTAAKARSRTKRPSPATPSAIRTKTRPAPRSTR